MDIRIKIVNKTFVYGSKKQEEWFAALLESYNNSGKEIVLSISEYSRDTTQAQRNLFKAMVAKGKDHTGMSYSEFESELISNFAPFKYIKDFAGIMHKVKKGVDEMNNKEFNDFIQECVVFMKEFFDLDFVIN